MCNLDAIEQTERWLLALALGEFSLQTLTEQTAVRLTEAGLPLTRLHVTVRLLHPIYSGTSVTWTRESGLEQDTYTPADIDSDEWRQSPLRHMVENLVFELDHCLQDTAEEQPYPLFERLHASGETGYFGKVTVFGDQATAMEREDGFIATWVCDCPGGWQEDHRDVVRRIQAHMAVAIRQWVNQQLAENVLTAYIGRDAGYRVLAGQVRRGDGEDIDAVIWFSDMRSSTRLAESLGRDRFLELLNGFFESTAGSVESVGGEVLSYIGDSVMAIFSFESFGSPESAAQAAMKAVEKTAESIGTMNRERVQKNLEPVGYGIGLHVGTVMFGNIGTRTRLNFTVVGSAANVAARITDKCRDLKKPMVVSGSFRSLIDRPWIDVGEVELKNVRDPIRLFVLER
ncbi:MAG: adenylate/guanylate cyclase domain-containing protein [Pseudomonadota bacterium]